jgi:peroxiredoxin Q/BCP
VEAVPSFPQPGDRAPDFELPGTDGDFRLSAQRGKPVVLLFYPRDQSLVCTAQFCAYRDHHEELSDLGAVAVGISAQDIASHERFIARHGLTLPLLADVRLEVAAAYGVRSRLLGTRRATLLIDPLGVVAYRREHPLSLGFDRVEDLRRALARAS